MKGNIAKPQRIQVKGGGYISLFPDDPSEKMSKKEREELVDIAVEQLANIIWEQILYEAAEERKKKAKKESPESKAE
jgi:hypothetical protein